MDLIQYQKERDSELSDFEKKYSSQKQKYSQALTDAIYEKDPQKQGQLVQHILDVNSELASEVRAFVAKQHDGSNYDPKAVSHLTDELIKYQSEYTKIKNTSDMITTLKMILEDDKSKVSDLKFQFNIFLGILILSIITIIFMIFKMSFTSMIATPTLLQAPLS